MNDWLEALHVLPLGVALMFWAWLIWCMLVRLFIAVARRRWCDWCHEDRAMWGSPFCAECEEDMRRANIMRRPYGGKR